MAAAGLIEHELPGRGMSGALRLTPTGTARLRAAVTVAVEAESAALSAISGNDQRRVTSVLHQLLEGLEQYAT